MSQPVTITLPHLELIARIMVNFRKIRRKLGVWPQQMDAALPIVPDPETGRFRLGQFQKGAQSGFEFAGFICVEPVTGIRQFRKTCLRKERFDLRPVGGQDVI